MYIHIKQTCVKYPHNAWRYWVGIGTTQEEAIKNATNSHNHENQPGGYMYHHADFKFMAKRRAKKLVKEYMKAQKPLYDKTYEYKSHDRFVTNVCQCCQTRI